MAYQVELKSNNPTQCGISPTVDSLPVHRRVPVAFRVTLAMFVCVLAITFSIVSAARIKSLNRIIEPPLELLPGNLVPINVPCTTTTFSQHFECRFNRDGEVGYLRVEGTPPRISQVTISARKQTLGSLIAAWGAPIKVVRSGIILKIYWETRRAFIVTCLLAPSNRVEFIGYGDEPDNSIPQTVLPWRGFTSQLRYGCSPGVKNP